MSLRRMFRETKYYGHSIHKCCTAQSYGAMSLRPTALGSSIRRNGSVTLDLLTSNIESIPCMKHFSLLYLLAMLLGTQTAHADEFNHEGIRIAFPGTSMEEQIGLPRPGFAGYRIRQVHPGSTEQTNVETFIHVSASDSYHAYGPNRAALLCLAEKLERVNRKDINKLSEPKPVTISGKAAMSFSMTIPGKYESDTFRDQIVNVAVYCIVEPKRQILIQVISPPSTKEELLTNTITGIEHMELTAD